MTAQREIAFENDRVRVTRITAPGSEPDRREVMPARRLDRLIIYLRDGRIEREEDGRRESLQRRAGEVVWRSRSDHRVTMAAADAHEVLVVELKS